MGKFFDILLSILTGTLGFLGVVIAGCMLAPLLFVLGWYFFVKICYYALTGRFKEAGSIEKYINDEEDINNTI